MKKTVSLEEARDEDEVGSKAASLAAISDVAKVPQGFVVTDQAFREFLERNGLDDKILSILARTRIDDRRELKDASREIKELFEEAYLSDELKEEITEAYKNFVISSEAKKAGRKAMELIKAGREKPPVVVRSSPQRDSGSSPGIYRSTLNVKGDENLVKEIKEVWKSFYTPEAIYYREKRGYAHDAPFGTLVQKMVSPDKTLAFLEADPCNPERSVLEGVRGIGELMSGGEVVPDRYFFGQDGSLQEIMKGSGEWIQEKNPSTGEIEKQPAPSSKKDEPVLDRAEAREIKSNVERIASRFGSHALVELLVRNGDIFIMDIASLRSSGRFEEDGSQKDIVSEGLGVSPGKASGRITRSERNSKGNVLMKNVPSVNGILFQVPEALLAASGGFSSNYAKLARELEIPSLILEGTGYSSMREDEEISVDAYNGVVFSEVVQGFSDEGYEQKESIMGNDDFLAQSVDSVTATELMLLGRSENFEPDRFSEAESCVVVVQGDERIGGGGFGMTRSRDITDKLADCLPGKDVWLKPSNSQGALEKTSEILKELHNKGFEGTGVLFTVSSFDEFKSLVNSVGISESAEAGVVVDTPELLLSEDEVSGYDIDLFLLDFESMAKLFFGHDRRGKMMGSDPFWSSVKDFCEACRNSGSRVSVSGVSDKRFLKKLVESGVDAVLVGPEDLNKVKGTLARVEKKLLLERMR